jgi:uncharacterized membrane protein YbhN (UPF0104 family)
MRFISAAAGSRWLRVAATLVLVALVVWRADPARLSSALGSVRPGYLALALALTVPFLYLKSARWYLMLRASGIEAGFGDAAVSLVAGMGLALLTPARLGELVRAAYLPDPRKWKIGGLVLLDKGFDVLVLAGLSIAGAAALLGWPLGVLLAAGTAAGLIAIYRPDTLLSLLHRGSARLPLRTKLESAWSSLDCLSPVTTSVFLLFTAASFAVVLVQFGLLLLSWRTWSFEIVFLTFPLVILTNVLPITIGGLGVREGAATLLLAHYGVPPAHAALAAFLMFALNTALPGIAGALLLPAIRVFPRQSAGSLDHP